MKYFILKALVEKLNTFKLLKHIKRVDNNIVQIEFEDRNVYYFDMKKAQSIVYKKDQTAIAYKDFNAPFDVVLKKRCIQASISRVYLYNDDKIINFELQSRSSYKSLKTILQFEFTGKHTNIIILDENRVVLEALRHIDSDVSSRIVKVGSALEEIPKANFIPKMEEIQDIDSYLYDIYKLEQEKKLDELKKQKINILQKEQKKVQNILENLEDKEVLEKESQNNYNKANLILANLYQIKEYQKQIEVIDFSGQKVILDLDTNNQSVKQYVDKLFVQAKKLKQKAVNQHQEKQNLEEKLQFINTMINLIKTLKNSDELEFYFPKKQKNQSKTKKAQPYQSFFYNGYKIMLGRDERENIYLLQNSKASDFWFHLKDRHSSHVIVVNSKKTLPQDVIEKAATICAQFSVQNPGKYLVDYTQRRNVAIQNRANVLYNPYQTISVTV